MTFSEFLHEGKGPYDYATTQITLPASLARHITAMGTTLIPQDILTDEGRETDPHITVLYGLTTDSPQDVAAVLGNSRPATYTLGPIQRFANPDADVVYISVTSPDLTALHQMVKQLQNVDEFPKYIPHITLAYVQPGRGATFVGDATFAGMTLIATDLEFKTRDGVGTMLPLGRN